MSQASDLIAEIKQRITRVERGIKNFEKDVEEVSHWTDLAQLRIAAQRLGIFEQTLADRKVDLEDATAPDPTQSSSPSPEVVPPSDPVTESPSGESESESEPTDASQS